MRVAGIRADGAVWLTLDGGLSVILSEDRCSPAVDPLACERLGPWTDAHGVSGSDRRELQLRLDRARTAPLATFQLEDRKIRVHAQQGKKRFKFEYSVSTPDEKPGEKADETDEKKDGDEVVGDVPDATAVAEGAVVPEAPVVPGKKATKKTSDA